MKIALIDEDRQARASLRETVVEGFLRKRIEITEFLEYDTGEEFLRQYGLEHHFDLIILDTLLSGASGIQIAKKIRAMDSTVRIVFYTSDNGYANEAFRVNASYYILKPVSALDVQEMIARLNLSELIQNRYVFLPDGQRIKVSTITYIVCEDHAISFHCTTGSVFRVRRLTFGKLEELLSPFPQFSSCTRGIVVNFDHVLRQTEDTFVMSCGATLPISRRRKKEVLSAWKSYQSQETARPEKCQQIPPPGKNIDRSRLLIESHPAYHRGPALSLPDI